MWRASRMSSYLRKKPSGSCRVCAEYPLNTFDRSTSRKLTTIPLKGTGKALFYAVELTLYYCEHDVAYRKSGAFGNITEYFLAFFEAA
jgi:hypothetical protein